MSAPSQQHLMTTIVEPLAEQAAAAAAETVSSSKKEVITTTTKKQRVVQTPTCPPAVATAVLILRAAAAAVTGSDANQIVTSLLQATYVKENALSGKFGIHYGKRLGDWCQLNLPEGDSTHAAIHDLLRTIERVANRIIAEQHAITCFRTTKGVVVERYGAGALDGSHAKTNPEEPVVLAVVGPRKDDDTSSTSCWLVAVTAGPHVYATTGQLRRIELDVKECKITAGKKAKKAEILFKFLAIEEHNNDNSDTVAAPLAEILEPTDGSGDQWLPDASMIPNATIRAPEGLEYQATQEAIAAAEMEKAQQQKSKEDQTQQEEAKQAALSSNIPQQQQQPDDEEEMVVNIEEVKGKIDYAKLVDQFGSTIIDAELTQKIEHIAQARGGMGKLHRFLRRNIFFSHRDLHTLLDAVMAGTPMYLYTGRGPSSSSMHLGHLIPFLFTKWLQDAFDAPLVIQMTDDEKFIFKGTYEDDTGDNLDYFAQLTIENAKDIIACGFDAKKTFLFSDLDYVGTMYPNIVRIWKAVTTNAVTHIFGFDGSANIGKIAFPAVQAAPSFASSFPKVLEADKQSDYLCLIPCAIDQDPYFRMTRDISHKMMHRGHKLGGKPALIHSKFFPPLQGATGKMSSSDTNSAIFLTDAPEEIDRKIRNHAFSGGQDTKEKQQELGADLDVDVSYQWLRFFLEDDEELESIGKSYGSGQGEYWSTSSVKARLIKLLQEIVAEHQARRAQITDDEVRKWMQERSIV
jgi:tryptophanyl-tRNA synthetase